MSYVVRTPHGELEFRSLQDLQQAYVQGLIDPHDEVRMGAGEWRKASSVAELERVRPTSRATLRGYGIPLLALILASLAIYFLWRASQAGSLERSALDWALALVFSLSLTAVLLRLTQKAFRRP